MGKLEIKNLQVEFSSDAGTVHAINDVGFEIEEGEILGLVGETGAGKTTTALSIIRLIAQPQGKITGGEIWFNDQDLLSLSEREMRKIRGEAISMIFQDPMTALNPIERVGDQIAEVIKTHEHCSDADAALRAMEMLELVGIPRERSDDYPHQFSGGMKQRVVIAIALACNPQLLIADEPTTALDVTIQAQILDLMRDLQKNLKTSMLLITHDLGVVAETCNKVAIMYAGEIVEYGSLEQVFDDARHPYTKGLFAAIPSLDKDVHRLESIDGLMPDPTALPTGCYFSPRCSQACSGCHAEHPEIVDIGSGHMVRCPYAL